jgi:hypothetical protein
MVYASLKSRIGVTKEKQQAPDRARISPVKGITIWSKCETGSRRDSTSLDNLEHQTAQGEKEVQTKQESK